MLFFLILGLLIGAISVIFALQNVVMISVNFLAWQFNGSLSLILLLALASGVLFSILLIIPEVIKNSIQFSSLKRQIRTLEDDNASYKRIVGDVSNVTNVSKVTETKITETNSVDGAIL